MDASPQYDNNVMNNDNNGPMMAPQDSQYGQDQQSPQQDDIVSNNVQYSGVSSDATQIPQFREEPTAEPSSNLIPAVINGNQQPSSPTFLPPLPTLSTPRGAEDEDADAAAQQAAEDESDPEVLKLNTALEAVKEDIYSNAKQIEDERKWVTAVKKIVDQYAEKSSKVQDHIVLLRQEMEKLYKKKKEIENLKLQHALESKLKEANDELSTLQNSLKHVQEKSSELNKSHHDLRSTIASIQSQLAKLKGEDPKLADQEVKEEQLKEDVTDAEEVKEEEEKAALGVDEEAL